MARHCRLLYITAMLCILPSATACRRPIVEHGPPVPVLGVMTAVNADSAAPASGETAASEKALTRTLEGHIVLLDREHSRLILDSHENPITINERSLVLLNGHESDLTELEAGLLATVLARQDKNQLVARAIDAHKVH